MEEKTEIQKIVEKQGMFISRMPEWAREEIQKRADVEFCGDYGMCIAQFIREGNELITLKTKFFSGDFDKLLDDKHSKEEEFDEIKMADGSIIKKRKGRSE